MENIVFVKNRLEQMRLDAQKLSKSLASSRKALKKNRPKEGSERDEMNAKIYTIDERIRKVKEYIKELSCLQNEIIRYKNERATIVRNEMQMSELRACPYFKTFYSSPNMSFHSVRSVKTPFQYVLYIMVDVEDL